MSPMKTKTREIPTMWDRRYTRLNAFGVPSSGLFGGSKQMQTTTGFTSSKDFKAELDEYTKVTRNGFTTYPPKFDTGHEFQTNRNFQVVSHPRVDISFKKSRYVGPLVPAPRSADGVGFASIPFASQNEVNRYGAAAISATRPLQAEASLSTLIGELRTDGLPSFSLLGREGGFEAWNPKYWRRTSKKLDFIGSEYLGNVFAWQPMITELLGLMHSVINVNKTLAQMDRDSGKVIRRRHRSIPITNQRDLSQNLVIQGIMPGGAETDLMNGGSYTGASLTETVYSDWRFSGAYSYYWPPAITAVDKMVEFERRANVVLGSRLTPAVLWELAPWSWLIDWHANVGDIISNASALSSDNLVIRYGYITRKTQVLRNVSIPNASFKNGWQPGTISTSWISEQLERYRATPFGFGLNPDGYNPAQWAIVAALGMTKSDKALRLVS